MRAELRELASWLGLPAPDGDRPVAGISTDSRTLRPGEAYLALVGERHDGHDYIAAAVKRGASAVICESGRCPEAGTPCLAVPDTLQAYGNIAAAWRRRFKMPVIAVTGSSGKTTCKDIVRAMMRERSIVATEGNENNDVGLPRTVLRIDERSEAACLEMGMRGLGQISRLCAIAEPQVGVVTNVGPAHLELLGDVKTVCRGKGELVESLPAGGTAVLNADDLLCKSMRERAAAHVVTFGFSEGADYRAVRYAAHGGLTDVEVETPDGDVRCRFNLIGKHNVYDLLAAMAAVREAGFAAESRTPELDVELSDYRGQYCLVDGAVFVMDCYNANPDSMKAAIDAFVAEGPGIAVLGEMAELGPGAAAYHRELGAYAAEAGVGALFAVGRYAEEAVAGARAAGLTDCHAYPDKAAAAPELRGRVEPGRRFLFKGSRVAGLEELADEMRRPHR